ncbi:hypothetical protein PSA01_20540 [Pseudonocardia saturnea]|uniref:Uncharacterized protein n=1 Tax=Pseudonocardia saturnea TaxID=33909 RepID=A0ABQ0RWI1_9PSEU|nr:hypothetical protein Pdca_11750 [Pseudonocardia autotrophica]GEC25025.1 hypothetical protein PSA01_20540 [Pseudonocardia saturnea]
MMSFSASAETISSRTPSSAKVGGSFSPPGLVTPSGASTGVMPVDRKPGSAAGPVASASDAALNSGLDAALDSGLDSGPDSEPDSALPSGTDRMIASLRAQEPWRGSSTAARPHRGRGRRAAEALRAPCRVRVR